MPGPIRARVRFAIASFTLGFALSACGDDDPSGPSANFDIVGQWSWRVTNATANGITCNVTGVTLTFAQDNGVLTGHRVASGGGNVKCTSNGSSSTVSYTTNDAIDNLSLSGTTIEFSFATTTGTWEMTGTITSDDTMSGTATIRLGTGAGTTLALTGPWTATRN